MLLMFAPLPARAGEAQGDDADDVRPFLRALRLSGDDAFDCSALPRALRLSRRNEAPMMLLMFAPPPGSEPSLRSDAADVRFPDETRHR